jgi:hypothetical protein
MRPHAVFDHHSFADAPEAESLISRFCLYLLSIDRHPLSPPIDSDKSTTCHAEETARSVRRQQLQKWEK